MGKHYEVVWSIEAEFDLQQTLDYLSQNWNIEIALKYIDILNENIKRINKVPKLHPLINKKLKIRKCVITEQNSLYYKLEGSLIILLRIFDSRQDPETLMY